MSPPRCTAPARCAEPAPDNQDRAAEQSQGNERQLAGDGGAVRRRVVAAVLQTGLAFEVGERARVERLVEGVQRGEGGGSGGDREGCPLVGVPGLVFRQAVRARRLLLHVLVGEEDGTEHGAGADDLLVQNDGGGRVVVLRHLAALADAVEQGRPGYRCVDHRAGGLPHTTAALGSGHREGAGQHQLHRRAGADRGQPAPGRHPPSQGADHGEDKAERAGRAGSWSRAGPASMLSWTPRRTSIDAGAEAGLAHVLLRPVRVSMTTHRNFQGVIRG